MTKLLLDDDLLDAQLLRAVGSAGHGGADIGECVQAVRKLDEKDLDAWYAAWTTLADRTVALARQEKEAGHRVSARLAYLRACTYYRTSGVMLFHPTTDPRLVDSNTQQTQAFREATALFDTSVEVLRIPYQDTTLPGYFFSADRPGTEAATRRATLVALGGYDGTCEELYFSFAAPALARGYHVLVFDGPGQGSALLQQGLVLRPDFEAVVTPVVDYALTRADVDPDRIALAGLSLGGYLAPRAASQEHRITALVADSGSFDIFAQAVARMPRPVADGLQPGHPTARHILAALVDRLAARPTAGWGLRRGMQVHGVATPLDYLEALRPYTLADVAGSIRCPTLVTYAEGDPVGASAPQLFDALTVPDRTLLRFTAAEGAGDHCEEGARTLVDARVFGWLDQRLQPQRAGSADPAAGRVV